MTEKKQITEKQKQVRLENMKKARTKRMQNIKEKKEASLNEEYDLSSEDPSSESDAGDFIISKKRPTQRTKEEAKKVKGRDDYLANEMNELKTIVYELASMQKKQHKVRKRSPKQGGTKIVVLPNNQSTRNASTDSVLEALRKQFM